MKKRFLVATMAVLAAPHGFASFKIVALPDTQKMSQYNPAAFTAQTQWIVDNLATENIEFVTHLGDVVNNNVPAQWSAATAAMDLLDGAVPYSVSIGNHDYDTYRTRDEGTEEFVSRFGPSHYAGYSWYKGSNRRGLDHCQVFSAGGREWLHLNFEYNPDDESLIWAQRMLDAYPDLPAIVSTHAYLSRTGVLGTTDSAMGDVSNGGANQWIKFVSHNDQIFMVLNGHYFSGEDGVASTTATNDFGHKVFQLCIDYQWEWDNGYLRTLEFDLGNNAIYAETFAPHTGATLTGPDDQFTLDIDFAARLGAFSRREEFPTLQAANLRVVEHNLDNNTSSVTVSVPAGQSTPAFSVIPPGTASYTDSNNGDYFVQVGSRCEDDLLNGIMIASVAENGRVGVDGTNHYHLVQVPAGAHGQYWLATATTANTGEYPGYTTGKEGDVNIAAAYFPFHQGWTGGRMTCLDNGKPAWSFMGSANIELGRNLVQLPQGTVTDTNLLLRPGGEWPASDTDRAVWNLEIPGEDSVQDGILLVCGGKNEDNLAFASPWPDGSGWQIAEKDNASGGTGTESDPLNLVYVPYSTANMVAGRMDGNGRILSGTGGFVAAKIAKGIMRLDIAGHSPADGTLIVSSELEGYSVDDFTTYEPEGDHWIVENRDLPSAGLAGSSSAQFAFLFVPFANAPARSGPGSGSGSGYYSVEWSGGDGLWLATNNWIDPGYSDFRGVPGWVAGNPLNTQGRTNRDWSASHAYVNSGTARIVPASAPDGRVGALDVGSAASATLEISADLAVKGETTLGADSLEGSVATINQTAGNVVLGISPAYGFRTYFGRGAGESVYNLSGGTLSTFADYDHFGRSGTGTFTFNQTGGTYRKVGGKELKVAVGSGVSATVNVADGMFECGADWLWVGTQGQGEFNQTGGDVRIHRLSMAHYAGASGTYRISGGSLVVTNAISGSQADSHASRFIVSGSGASRIETMRFYGWDDVLRVELDNAGSTLIRVSGDTGASYDSTFADLRKCRFEVATLPGFGVQDGTVFDVLWSEGDILVDDTDPTYAMQFTNLATRAFDWRVVQKDGGKMLQLVLGEGPVFGGRHVLGLRKSFPITDAAQTLINVSGGIAYDPSSRSGGVFDKLYLVNRTDSNTRWGLYSIDLANESHSDRLALDGASTVFKYPADVVVDSSGTAYVAYNYAPSVWKIEDPEGAASATQLLGDYGGTGDDDPEGLAMVPTAFGGGYVAGSDLALFDSGINVNETEGAGIVGAASTAASPAYASLWDDGGGSPDDSLRGDASEFDGHLYFMRTVPETADLNGLSRAYVSRLDSAGTLERVFLDIDPSMVPSLDDAIAINPVDGSLWLNVHDLNGSDPNRRNIYRVDLANATALGGGDYLAEVSLSIWNTGYNLGKNGMAISPDGRQLATVCPDGVDTIQIYDIVSETPFSDWAAGHGLGGSDAAATNDYDGDGLDNLYEYGLGGDPADPASRGVLPIFGMGEGGTNGLRYIYPKRSDPGSGISYHLELTDDLVSGVWTNAGYETIGTGTINSGFDAVTNRIPTDMLGERFIRLIIGETFWFEQ